MFLALFIPQFYGYRYSVLAGLYFRSGVSAGQDVTPLKSSLLFLKLIANNFQIGITILGCRFNLSIVRPVVP
jgi:hypothetical protein